VRRIADNRGKENMMRETITATTCGNKTISLVRLLPGIVPGGSGDRVQKEGWLVQVTYEGNPCTYGRQYREAHDAKWAYVEATAGRIAKLFY
jgi:hypothetical protein